MGGGLELCLTRSISSLHVLHPIYQWGKWWCLSEVHRSGQKVLDNKSIDVMAPLLSECRIKHGVASQSHFKDCPRERWVNNMDHIKWAQLVSMKSNLYFKFSASHPLFFYLSETLISRLETTKLSCIIYHICERIMKDNGITWTDTNVCISSTYTDI